MHVSVCVCAVFMACVIIRINIMTNALLIGSIERNYPQQCHVELEVATNVQTKTTTTKIAATSAAIRHTFMHTNQPTNHSDYTEIGFYDIKLKVT